ncbi:MAG: C69 family dipeptidase [Bacteroidales bacterium]|nr:C69 family dipeptidase [Bacteroidales bacterium]
MKNLKKMILFGLLFLLFGIISVQACTNFIVTKGASKDGSVMVSYAADSHLLYGELYHWPAARYQPGAMLDIYEWDTGKFLGRIKQAAETYNVVGNVNEHQVAIGETTFGGREGLEDTTAIIDYGSLIYITLQRAKSAREAMKIMTELVAEYGYYSSGESFSVIDKNEAWILEMIGKGPGNKGAVWVARLIPDGYVSGHANQARITTFDFQQSNNWFDPNQTVFHAPDVITFARQKGYFNGQDREFSFSDTYNPLSFGGARFCEIRVWAFFNAVTTGMESTWEYVKGNVQFDEKGYAVNRMPLWVRPTNKLSHFDIMKLMGDHLEGTELDMTKDIGAGPYNCPYRWRPLTWTLDDQKYFNERAAGTQQTAFSFVAQMRSWLPDQIGGINWFGLDDAATTLYVPMYCGITDVPRSFKQGNGSLMVFSMESAFWIFNMVSNWAYTRYRDMYPDIQKVQEEMYALYAADIERNDREIADLFNSNREEAINKITDYSVNAGALAHQRWVALYGFLFSKYLDGYIKTPAEVPEGYKFHVPNYEWPGYGEEWYRRIVNETGDQFRQKPTMND